MTFSSDSSNLSSPRDEENYAARDALFISHPKSGRTWVRFFLRLRGIQPRFRHVETGLGRISTSINVSPADEAVIIFMHRNPIDTAVSYYFQVHKKEFRFGTRRYFSRFLRYFLSGRLPPRSFRKFLLHSGYGVERICRFNRAWLDRLASHKDALILSYEDARADEEGTFTAILRFLDADTANVTESVEASRFDAMRKQEREHAGNPSWLMMGSADDPESAKVRRGKVGGYVDYLDEDTIAECKAIAARYGFDA